MVQASSEERVDALDAHLWTYRDDNFLPHGTSRESEAAMQPILLTIADDNPNGATVRFLIDGAPMPADAASYQRIVLLFDGEDDEAVGGRAGALGRGQGAGVRGHLLAAGRKRPLAAQRLSLSANRPRISDLDQSASRGGVVIDNPRCATPPLGGVRC